VSEREPRWLRYTSRDTYNHPVHINSIHIGVGVLDEVAHDGRLATTHGIMEWSPSRDIVDLVNVGAGLHQLDDGLLVALARRHMQGRTTRIIGRIDVGSGVDEDLEHLELAVLGCDVERRARGLVASMYRLAAIQQQLGHGHLAEACRIMKRMC